MILLKLNIDVLHFIIICQYNKKLQSHCLNSTVFLLSVNYVYCVTCHPCLVSHSCVLWHEVYRIFLENYCLGTTVLGILQRKRKVIFCSIQDTEMCWTLWKISKYTNAQLLKYFSEIDHKYVGINMSHWARQVHRSTNLKTPSLVTSVPRNLFKSSEIKIFAV